MNTKQVFGDYIDIYDIQRAIDDGATVPIYYEARLAKLRLKDEQRPKLDPDFEEVTEGEEEAVKEKLKSKWSQLEAMVGTEERLAQIAAGHRDPLRAARADAGREGHDRLHEPPHLRRPV